MAMWGLRQRSTDSLVNALVALAIAASWAEPKDILMTLAVVYRSGEILGNPKDIFLLAESYIDDEPTRTLLLDFPDRLPVDRSIEAMGFREVDGPSGLVYVHGFLPIPEGLL